MTDILIPKKNVVFDSQILSSLMSCARLTDYRFNLNLVSVKGKSVSLEMGSIVHVFLENYYKNIIGRLKRDQAESFAHTAAMQYIESDEVKNCTEEDKKWAILTCHQYLDFYKSDFWIPLAVEETRGAVLYEDDEIRILWKVKYDLIMDTTQGIYPIDTKTMKQNRDTLTLNNQFIGQCIVMNTRKMFINKVGFQKTLPYEERFKRVALNFSADRLLEWQSVILPYYAKQYLVYAETGYWPPNFTHCENKYGFCSFREVCEADRNLREETLGNEYTVGKAWDVTNDET